MTVLPPAITPATASQRLQNDGLAALGLTMPLLSPTWSSAAVTFNEPQLTLTMTSQVQAPMLAIRSWVTDLAPHGLYGTDGLPLAGPGAIVRLHPQAALRLDRLMRARLGAAAGDIRPVPTTMAIRNVSDTLAPQWFNPGTMVAPEIPHAFAASTTPSVTLGLSAAKMTLYFMVSSFQCLSTADGPTARRLGRSPSRSS